MKHSLKFGNELRLSVSSVRHFKILCRISITHYVTQK